MKMRLEVMNIAGLGKITMDHEIRIKIITDVKHSEFFY